MASTHFQKHLIHECTIQRNTPVRSASGEPIPDWADSDTEVSCRYVERSERIASEGIGFMMLEQHMLLLNAGEDVLEEDRITDIVFKSDSSSVDAGPFSVEAVLKRSSTAAHHISLRLERVE